MKAAAIKGLPQLADDAAAAGRHLASVLRRADALASMATRMTDDRAETADEILRAIADAFIHDGLDHRTRSTFRRYFPKP